MLRNSLNDRLITTLAGNHLLPEDNFNEWVRIVGHVAQQLEVVDGRNRRLKQYSQLNSVLSNDSDKSRSRNSDVTRTQNFDEFTRSGTEFGRAGQLDSSGDMFMGG